MTELQNVSDSPWATLSLMAVLFPEAKTEDAIKAAEEAAKLPDPLGTVRKSRKLHDMPFLSPSDSLVVLYPE